MLNQCCREDTGMSGNARKIGRREIIIRVSGVRVPPPLPISPMSRAAQLARTVRTVRGPIYKVKLNRTAKSFVAHCLTL
jgi:hypothetical protein